MRDYNEMKPAKIIGSFIEDSNADFNNGLVSLNETFSANYGLDAIDDITKIVKDDVLYEQYKELLIGDIMDQQFETRYLGLLPSKLEQVVENSRAEMVKESYGVAQLSPVVGYTLPIIKKNMLTCISKDLMMTEVPDAPIVKVVFERKFLKDNEGNKYYIPEIFYNDDFKAAAAKAKGKDVSGDLNCPAEEEDWLGTKLGNANVRRGLDSYTYDIRIDKVTFRNAADNADVEVTGLNIKPDVTNDGVFYKEVKQGDEKTIVVGRIDFYTGKISCASLDGKLSKVHISGTLSNQFNDQSLDLDRDRISETWEIEEQERLNTALTIEKIRDMKAMANIDITPEIVNDMATTLTQFEDSSVLDFLHNSLVNWSGKSDTKFGYEDQFVETAKFDCNVNSGLLSQSDYIDKELKFRFNRLITQLKTKMRTEELMFVAFGHPNNIELINSAVKWIVDENTRVGGIQLDYKFGVMTETASRVHFVSSLKVPESEGIRVLAYPTTNNNITFKHYKYSFNIENMYHHPVVGKVPNIMGTQRYLTTDMIAIQGQMELVNSNFGIASRPKNLTGKGDGDYTETTPGA